MTVNWHWTLNNDKYSVCTKDLPLRLKCWSILLFELWFLRYVPENLTCIEWPQTELEHLAVKSTLYTYILTPSFVLRLAVSEIQDNQNRKRTEWAQTEAEHLTVKIILYTLNIYLWGPTFGPFAIWPEVFQIQCRRKLEMHRMTQNWTSTLNSQNYSLYTKHLPLRPNFWSISIYG